MKKKTRTVQRLIVYQNSNETLVCHEKDEKRLLKLWFKEGGREVDDGSGTQEDPYTRDEGGIVGITTSQDLDFDFVYDE